MHSISPIRFVTFAAWIAVSIGSGACSIQPDPDFPPPLAPLPPDQRVSIRVEPVENASPSAAVAEWSYPTRLYVEQLLERTRRFKIAAEGEVPTGGVLRVRFTDVRDEAFLETVVFNAEQQRNRKRRAIVEMDWKFEPTAGASRGSKLISDELKEGGTPLDLPTRDQLTSGSFWETPYGIATREDLDSMVRQLASSP